MNETATCRCGKPTRDQAYVCDDCSDKFARALGECPWVDEELDITLGGQRGVDYRRGGGSPSSEVKLPVNLAASDAARDLRGTLAKWVKFCADEHVRNQSPRLGIPTDDVPSMSRWLMWRVDGLAFLEAGGDAVDEITAAVARGKRLVDRPADKWYAGPCDCGEDLYARMQKGSIKCGVTDCGLVYDIAERRAWLLDEAEDRLANAATIARAVSWLGSTPLTAERVRKWAERDRILARGHDGKSPLYRVGDAIDLLAKGTKAS